MTFSKYTSKDVQTLLKAIDVNLNKKFEIILIGGAAALLAYKATRLFLQNSRETVRCMIE